VEGLTCWFIEPQNGFFNTQTVYGRDDDEVGGAAGGWQRRTCRLLEGAAI
jgi:hypothetical protein